MVAEFISILRDIRNIKYPQINQWFNDLYPMKNNIEKVVTNELVIKTVADNILEVYNTGINIEDVKIVSNNIPNITATALNTLDINQVAGNIGGLSVIGNDLSQEYEFIEDNGLITDDVLNTNGTSILNTIASNITEILLVDENAAKAKLWAEELEDVPVEPNQYSAKHWAIKASRFVLDDIIDDTVIMNTKTYSSVKIENRLENLDFGGIT